MDYRFVPLKVRHHLNLFTWLPLLAAEDTLT